MEKLEVVGVGAESTVRSTSSSGSTTNGGGTSTSEGSAQVLKGARKFGLALHWWKCFCDKNMAELYKFIYTNFTTFVQQSKYYNDFNKNSDLQK